MSPLLIILMVILFMMTVISITALIKKSDSIYKSQPDEKNPFEGKKVRLVMNEGDPINADGICGHLESDGISEHHPITYEKYVKRFFDIAFSLVGLTVLSPVFLIIALVIIIDDPGSVILTQKRVGQNKRYFKLHKFRSMKTCTPLDKPTHMLDDPEQYITKAGQFLRRHSLDELPQIWDVLLGNMSFIGPRPGLWNQDYLIAERDKWNANDVKPGLTGWAQINGRDELEIPVKAELDGEYCKKMGFKMDFKCFFCSIKVFGGDEHVVEGKGNKR